MTEFTMLTLTAAAAYWLIKAQDFTLRSLKARRHTRARIAIPLTVWPDEQRVDKEWIDERWPVKMWYKGRLVLADRLLTEEGFHLCPPTGTSCAHPTQGDDDD